MISKSHMILISLISTTSVTIMYLWGDALIELSGLKTQYLPHLQAKPQYINLTNYQHSNKRSYYAQIMAAFLTACNGPIITKRNWKGNCPWPFYIPTNMQRQSWWQPYLNRLQQVDLSKTSDSFTKMRACLRWWNANPQYTYYDPPAVNQTFRGQEYQNQWKPKPRPQNYTKPKCVGFGRAKVPRSRCGDKLEAVWRTLDELGIIYFPKVGSELGVLRHASYLSTDGDMDIYVDMPQKALLKEMLKVLGSPAPYIYEFKEPEQYKNDLNWYPKGCPPLHLFFFDLGEDEMSQGNFSRRAGHEDICECFLNSVPMSCHKNTVYRVWLTFGPAWRVPLHAKAFDVPWLAYDYSTKRKLRGMTSNDGVIHEEAVRDLDQRVEYGEVEMKMILAQLNDLHALIICQSKRECAKQLLWTPYFSDSLDFPLR